MIACRATFAVPGQLVQFTAKLLLAERPRRSAPTGRGAYPLWRAAVGGAVVPRPRDPGALARDNGISRTTACQYIDEVVSMLAEQASELAKARERAKGEGHRLVVLRQGPRARRQHPGRTRPGRVPAMDLAA